MKNLTKKWLIVISLVFILISLIFPFYLAEENDSILTILSASFTAVGTVIALIALYIAIVLYQKFGLESKFIEKRADKVLELVDLLKGRTYTIQTKKFKYFMRFEVDDIKSLSKEPYYIYLKDKTILMNTDDYEKGTKQILNIANSYWLPNEIKKKLEFFKTYAFEEIDEKEKYAKLKFEFGKKPDNMEWLVPIHKFTVEEFIINKNKLSLEIQEWLTKHCEIKLDLKLNSPNQIEKN
tara:strand:+ start:1222 stop:1935 length:714 start_codon:yes stop_codon:yes gene_type:complete